MSWIQNKIYCWISFNNSTRCIGTYIRRQICMQHQSNISYATNVAYHVTFEIWFSKNSYHIRWSLLTPRPDQMLLNHHDDVIKWKHFPRNWPFVRGIHRSPMNSPHKGQWRGALMFSLICDWINDWVNNREAGDLRRHRGHYDVIVMVKQLGLPSRIYCPHPNSQGSHTWVSRYCSPHCLCNQTLSVG